MTLNEYQQQALTTAWYPKDMKIVYPTLGLNGEAGEVAEKVKKIYRDNQGEVSAGRRADILKEIGDVLWYCATLAADLGASLDDVGQMNIDKLASRKQRGMIHGNGDNR